MSHEAKLAVVNTLKQNGEMLVTLSGGIKDDPNLKIANIVLAMGSKGTEMPILQQQ